MITRSKKLDRALWRSCRDLYDLFVADNDCKEGHTAGYS